MEQGIKYIISTKDIAEYLGVCRMTLYNYRNTYTDFPIAKVNGVYTTTNKLLDEWRYNKIIEEIKKG